MKIVSMDAAKDLAEKQKKDLLEVLDTMRDLVEKGEMKELVCASIDSEGEVSIHVCVKDFLGALGMFELGKKLLIEEQGYL
jgi:DNA polymerase/3'-5' exonuclease PolX